MNWKRFIANCKLDKPPTIEKTSASMFYSVKDDKGTNWLKLIIDNEPMSINKNERFPLDGLLEALVEDGCDPNARVILVHGKSSCTILRYAKD